MGQILLSVMLPKSVYWRCFLIQARSRSLSDMYRMGSCVFWYASSGLLGLSWQCQPEIYSLQQPDKIPLVDVIRFLGTWAGSLGTLSKVSWFHQKIQGLVEGKGSMFPEMGVLELIGLQCPFPWWTDIRCSLFPLLVSLLSREAAHEIVFVTFLWCPPAEGGWMGCEAKEQLSKGTDHSAPSWDNSDIFTAVQVSPLSAYPELHHLVQYGPKVWQNQNLFPYLRSEPGAFNHGKQRLTAQSTGFKEARELLMKKSVYSAWIMGTGIWLLLMQAWQLCRCYSVQYYSKV